MSKEMKLYLMIVALTAVGLGFSNDIISNYFKDAYQVTAFQRGMIELPRELPGILCILVISMLSFLNDIKIAILAQALSTLGMVVLGLITPSYTVMLVFIFINSMGMHLFFPLQDSIGLALTGKGQIGKRMGQFKGIFTAFQMVAAVLVFIGFRTGFFSFETSLKLPFLVAGFLFLIVLILLVRLQRMVHIPGSLHQKTRLIVRKEYRYYYILVIMFGVQKQIMMVYGPWVLIDLLSKKADTIAMLAIIGGLIGIFFIPALGRWMDRFGIKTMLYADALSFIAVYLIYGTLSAGYNEGWLARAGWPVMLAYLIFVLDRMSTQMGLVRTVYLRTIAVKSSDITPTLSFGLSLDHVVTILCAALGGIIWGTWGPQYIFFLAASLSLVNLYVAFKVELPVNS
ncbi:MAG: MFS transporter [Proteobacteria bacterium]|nr:MFS transporter [Desulfobacula sp.]MBU3952942.1 MFS transporter [Pseudomonadota bacterium]MBU4129526.1 MFS transporter [Pseudomonadota bacterium]